MKIQVYSEIGKLKTVLLHRPGKELENLTPDILERLLFDDIPYLKVAQEEHDFFAKTLRDEGVEVLYIKDMVVESLENHPEVLSNFLNQFIEESHILSKAVKDAIYNYLANMTFEEIVEKMIEGIRTNEVKLVKNNSIMDMLENEYPFYTDPMPNILFQRDPFATIGRGVSINKMYTDTRARETIFSDYMFKYHPRFENEEIPRYYNRYDRYNSEGGDMLVLNSKTLAIGISKRTDPRAIEHLAGSIFESDETFETILAFNIPKTRAFMHLDTVFTQIDYGVFTIHPLIMKHLTVFEITKENEKIKVTKVVSTLEDILKKHLHTEIKLINCGGDDMITSGREQWNDGANTLAVEPGKVIVYSRNHVTNDMLRKNGITVLEIPSSELSRGRGGPRCMSMPLFREKI
ncbi:arginine deiminase [Candidatus Izimaplasma bacterium ZiA1]|uniref:arginine deiminase n=1 Tax=Candidatus Izimoplasma sp. ZiA1 TaxID=2024899 RepID=UPI000BAA5455|nr:arginine deiminase [Candidatus Izimaplasma bacterium ZiA1]